jgi:hydroxymethylbilane synthase
MSALRIGTRKSPLAIWQAERVRDLLAARGQPAELVRITTTGDRILDRPLAEVGGKGLFVKELEEALRDGRADLAVHSAKDVPFELPEEFGLCAFPERDDPRDALVAPRARTWERLPKGSRVGTSSLRRAVQLLSLRPDLVIVPVRGNVQTRLSKAVPGLEDGVSRDPARGDPQGPLDAVVLALAGLRRLGLEEHVTEVLPIEVCLPAAGQGALAIEARRSSRGWAAASPLDDPGTSPCVRAERALLATLSGGCTLPLAAYAAREGDSLHLRAALGGPDGRGGTQVVRAQARGAHPEELGAQVAAKLLDAGAGPLLEAARAQAGGLPAPRR